ncbi:MAG: PilZ domain-containing protein, partial [Asticcacaulis sp.]|nr:PilZ domain-containing protein [Asticcacaulis sp.]
MTAKIVHEASSQRQYIRVRVPISVRIGDDVYQASDWSVAGVSVANMKVLPAIGQIVPLSLLFRFENFSFELDITGEVRRVNSDQSVGFAFADLDAEKLSLLQYLIGAQLSGEVVQVGDVLAIMKRENFTGARLKPKGDGGGRNVGSVLQRLVLLCLLWAIGLGLTGYIAYSGYSRAFFIHADGVLASPDAKMLRAPKAGTVLSVDGKPGQRVQPNQALASLEAIDGSVTNVAGGCDCIMGEALAAPG